MHVQYNIFDNMTEFWLRKMVQLFYYFLKLTTVSGMSFKIFWKGKTNCLIYWKNELDERNREFWDGTRRMIDEYRKLCSGSTVYSSSVFHNQLQNKQEFIDERCASHFLFIVTVSLSSPVLTSSGEKLSIFIPMKLWKDVA